jgi:putative membrane protein
MRIVTFIITIILIVFGLTFALMNAMPVTLNYYVGVLHISLSLLLVLTLRFGILIGLIVALGPILRTKKEKHLLRNRVKHLEHELENAQKYQKEKEAYT